MQPRGESSRSVGLTENCQRQDRGIHSESVEHSRNSLRLPTTKEKGNDYISTDNCQGRDGLHSELIESLQNLLKAVSVGKSQIQATDCVNLQQVPLAGYKQFPQEMQTYIVSREPVMVQPASHGNNSALLDLPNVQTGLPPPLTPQQLNQVSTESVDGRLKLLGYKKKLQKRLMWSVILISYSPFKTLQK